MAAHTNRLAGETSPYLLQHAHNPVDWFPWGEEALRRAREEDRPILLSVGYSACHWCHVMERESFGNEEIAALMNAHFVCIKVDREERPDLDHLYMNAVQMLTGQGGWPMTVFLTPDGKPFYGGTYYPPEDRYGRPGFPRILQAVAQAWRERRQEIEEQGGAMVAEMRRLSEFVVPPGLVTPDLFDRAFHHLMQSYDVRRGGFGGAPKFPQPALLDFLLRYAHRTHNKQAVLPRASREEPLRMATFTLERMAMGGMYDHLGGGFHRYSTDEYWLVPHFEKMLYDNAQLAPVYLRAWQVTGDTLFRRVAEETLNYVRREMTSPEGGFYSTQDADSEGEEGKFFVWTEEEIKEVLGPEDAALFARCYGITPRGNWEHKNILNLSAPLESLARALGEDPAAFEARLAAMRRRLFARREARVKPGRDEKVLTAWNGLMLAAFAEAAAVLDRADYLQTAINNAEFVLRELVESRKSKVESGQTHDSRLTTHDSVRLMRTGKDSFLDTPEGMDHPLLKSSAFKVAPIPGFLEDYACCADGLLRLYEATGEWRWLDAARGLADAMVVLFADPNGGFFSTAADAEELVERPKDMMDSATPSGNSMAAEVLLRLAVLTGEETYRERAAAILRKLVEPMAQHPATFGRLLSAADFFVGPVKELAVIGAKDQPETRALLAAARAAYHPNLVLAQAEPDDARAVELPLLAARPQVDGKPTAYVCENYVCRQPTTDPAALTELLKG
jgi:uncharacterized protein YyaL (SSP411 family)